MANPVNEITKTLSKSAVASENRKIGKAMLNFTERNNEKTRKELYIHILGITALKTNTTTEG
jgi:hypothetical protein